MPVLICLLSGLVFWRDHRRVIAVRTHRVDWRRRYRLLQKALCFCRFGIRILRREWAEQSAGGNWGQYEMQHHQLAMPDSAAMHITLNHDACYMKGCQGSTRARWHISTASTVVVVKERDNVSQSES